MVNVLWVGEDPRTSTTSSLMGWPVCERLVQRGVDITYLAIGSYLPPYELHDVKIISPIIQDEQTPYGMGSVKNMFNIIHKRVSPDVVVVCLEKTKLEEILFQLKKVGYDKIIIWSLSNEYLDIKSEHIKVVQSFNWKGRVADSVIHACINPLFKIGCKNENILFIDRDYEAFKITNLYDKWMSKKNVNGKMVLLLGHSKCDVRIENLLSVEDNEKIEVNTYIDKGAILDNEYNVVDAGFFYMPTPQHMYNIGSIECLLSGLKPVFSSEYGAQIKSDVCEFENLIKTNFADFDYLKGIFDENTIIAQWYELLNMYQKKELICDAKNGINFKGNIWGNGSMSLTSRLLALTLNSLGMDVSLENTVLKTADQCAFFNSADEREKLMKLENKKIDASQYIHIRYSGPQAGESHLLEGLFDYTIGKRNIAYWSIDYSLLGGKGCPSPGLLNAIPDSIWVPSMHSKVALVNSGVVEEKISIVPNGFWDNVFVPQNREKNRKFVFLHISNFKFYLRKGIDVLLEAFIKAFDKNDDVELRIHSQNEENLSEIYNFISEFQRKYNNSPVITITIEPLSHKEMCHLYNSCDCFVFPSRGESFGLPPLEAMACMKPVIVTNWGGMIDFCNTRNAYLIDYDLVPVKTWLCQGWGGGLQANPKVDSLVELMLQVYNSPEQRNTKALYAYQDAKKWTWEKAAYKAKKIIDNM